MLAIVNYLEKGRAPGLIIKRSIALLNLGEKGISLFFNRRWTQINADTGLDNSPAI